MTKWRSGDPQPTVEYLSNDFILHQVQMHTHIDISLKIWCKFLCCVINLDNDITIFAG